MLRDSSSFSNNVGIQEFFGFLRSLTPTKQEPLSDRMVAGTPNLLMVCLSIITAFFEVASLKRAAPVTHREASYRYVIRFIPFIRGSFMACQSACHMAFE